MSAYRIRTVAQMTGMSPALLRAWEARYGLITPTRSQSGYRLYSDEEVALLLGAQRLVQQGVAPMQVARLPRSKLLAAGGSLPPQTALRAEPAGEHSYSELLEPVLGAVKAFDRERLDELVTLPILLLKPEVACRTILAPLWRELGERWHRGELSVAMEHFGSALLRSKLTVLLDILRVRPAAHRVLCACPPGELHEIGLLLFSIEAATQGFEPIYLGANVPIPDLGSVAQKLRPDLVATSIVMARGADDLAQLLTEIKAAVGKLCPILVGGYAISGHEELVRATGCLTLPESRRLSELLPSRQERTSASRKRRLNRR